MGTRPSQLLMFFVCTLLNDPSVSVRNSDHGIHEDETGFGYHQYPRLSVIYPDGIERFFHAEHIDHLTSREFFNSLQRTENSINILPDVIRLHHPNSIDNFAHLTRDGGNVQTLHNDFTRDLQRYNNFNFGEYLNRTRFGRNMRQRELSRQPSISFIEFGSMMRDMTQHVFPRDEAQFLNGPQRSILHVWGEPERTPKYWMLFRRTNDNNQHEMPNHLYSYHSRNNRSPIIHLRTQVAISPEMYNRVYHHTLQSRGDDAGSASSSGSTSRSG